MNEWHRNKNSASINGIKIASLFAYCTPLHLWCTYSKTKMKKVNHEVSEQQS